MISTFPDDVLYSSYEETQEPDGSGVTKKAPKKRKAK
jgi:hypothetical protein